MPLAGARINIKLPPFVALSWFSLIPMAAAPASGAGASCSATSCDPKPLADPLPCVADACKKAGESAVGLQRWLIAEPKCCDDLPASIVGHLSALSAALRAAPEDVTVADVIMSCSDLKAVMRAAAKCASEATLSFSVADVFVALANCPSSTAAGVSCDQELIDALTAKASLRGWAFVTAHVGAAHPFRRAVIENISRIRMAIALVGYMRELDIDGLLDSLFHPAGLIAVSSDTDNLLVDMIATVALVSQSHPAARSRLIKAGAMHVLALVAGLPFGTSGAQFAWQQALRTLDQLSDHAEGSNWCTQPTGLEALRKLFAAAIEATEAAPPVFNDLRRSFFKKLAGKDTWVQAALPVKGWLTVILRELASSIPCDGAIMKHLCTTLTDGTEKLADAKRELAERRNTRAVADIMERDQRSTVLRYGYALFAAAQYELLGGEAEKIDLQITCAVAGRAAARGLTLFPERASDACRVVTAIVRGVDVHHADYFVRTGGIPLVCERLMGHALDDADLVDMMTALCHLAQAPAACEQIRAQPSVIPSVVSMAATFSLAKHWSATHTCVCLLAALAHGCSREFTEALVNDGAFEVVVNVVHQATTRHEGGAREAPILRGIVQQAAAVISELAKGDPKLHEVMIGLGRRFPALLQLASMASGVAMAEPPAAAAAELTGAPGAGAAALP